MGVTSSLAYELIVSAHESLSTNKTMVQIWNFNIPLKLKCFVWLILENRINTLDILSRKGWIGPSRCCLCLNVQESINHIFVSCSFVRNVIEQLNSFYGHEITWTLSSILGNIEDWYQKTGVSSHLIWNIWITRNSNIFEGRKFRDDSTCVRIPDQVKCIL